MGEVKKKLVQGALKKEQSREQTPDGRDVKIRATRWGNALESPVLLME